MADSFGGNPLVNRSEITVMTYNVANGLAPPDRLVLLLRESGADVIGLQELTTAQAAAIARHLSDHYPHQALHPLGIPGKALLSRFPLREAALLPFHPGRPDLRAVVDAPGGPLPVIVAHPPPPRLRRGVLAGDAATREQIAALIAAATAGEPTVLLGDFNVIDRQAAYRGLTAAGLIDAFGAAGSGRGGTLPTRFARWARGRNPVGKVPLLPLLRVDYVWHTPHLRALDAWIGGHAGSDHLPVLARLARRDQAAAGGAARPR